MIMQQWEQEHSSTVFSYERKELNLHGSTFSYLDWASPRKRPPLLLFSHANGMNALTYRRLLEPLADEIAPIAWDFRGQGFSFGRQGQQLNGWEDYARDMIDFLETLPTPIVLAGHSLGGVTSLIVAHMRPDLVKGLVLIDPVIFPPSLLVIFKLLRLFNIHDRFPIAVRASKRQAIWESPEQLFNSYHGRGAFKTWPDEILRDYLSGGVFEREDGKVELCCSPAWEARTFSFTPTKPWKWVKQLKMPLTVVYGNESNAFLKPAADRIKRLQPNAKMIGVDSATHFVAMEEPEITREAIRNMCLALNNI